MLLNYGGTSNFSSLWMNSSFFYFVENGEIMFLQIILLIIGFIILIKGADFFVDGASGIAENFHVSKMLIGLTIVAFGTSAPEFAVSVKSLLAGSGEISTWKQKGREWSNIRIGNTSKTMTQSSANSNRYYCEIDLSANSNYGFFIIDGSDYYKGDYNGNVTATSNYSTEVKNYGSKNYGDSPHRVNYKSGTAGTYIFTYDASNHKICVSPKSSETIKIAYDIAQGHDGDWNLNNYVNLTQVGSTANYTIDLDLQATKYYMFVQISNGIYWRAGSNLTVNGSVPLYYYGTNDFGGSGDKVNFTPTKAGKHRFTWNHQDKTIKLEPFYSVTYNGNSHTSGSVPATSQHLKGSTVTVASNSGNLARTGYTFGGWNTNSTGTKQ